MRFQRLIYLWIIVGVFLCIGAASAKAANNVLNPHHCDFNKDGKADVLWQTGTTLAVWYMNGINPPTSVVIPEPVYGWAIACGDFLGDGNTDIIWGPVDGMVTVWVMDGVTPIQICSFFPPSSPGWKVETLADMDGLGPLDILWSNSSTGQHAIWYTSGCGTIRGYASLPTLDPRWSVIATGDFNGDGNADLVWCCNSDGQYAIWLMNNTTILSAAAFGPFPDWALDLVADFDGDGKSDLLWVKMTEYGWTGEYSIWFMDGTTIKSNPSLPSVTNNWFAGGADDYDGDGHVDILWQGSNFWVGGTDLAVWLMDGSQVLQSGYIATAVRGWDLVR